MQDNEKRLRANWVWMKLQEMYGNSFTKSFGHQPSDTWVNGLALLDKSEVVEGLNKLLIDGHVFPPSTKTQNGRRKNAWPHANQKPHG